MYYITKKDIEDKNILFNFIYPNKFLNYYISDDFSPQFYIILAKAGFISVYEVIKNIEHILPEIQLEYAVLYFDNLHISKKVNKLLKQNEKYIFKVNNSFEEVLKLLKTYHHDCWIEGKYIKLLQQLQDYKKEDFTLMCFEIWCIETNKLISAEIGYKIYNTYTSLSGFTTKEKRYNNYGKLQMTLLANYLEENNYAFWNMGHPHMKYKLDLGAKVLIRDDFLKIWLKEVKDV